MKKKNLKAAEKIAEMAEATIVAQSKEISDFLAKKGFTQINVCFGHSFRDHALNEKNHFELHIYARVNWEKGAYVQ